MGLKEVEPSCMGMRDVWTTVEEKTQGEPSVNLATIGDDFGVEDFKKLFIRITDRGVAAIATGNEAHVSDDFHQ